MVHGEMSREHLVAEVADLRRRLSEVPDGRAIGAARQDVPEAPSFAYFNPSPVLRFDSNGTVLTINPSAVELIGPEAMEGSSLVSILPAMTSVNLGQTIASDAHIDFETEIGGRWFHFVVVGVSEYGVGHVYGYDITVRHRAQNALRASIAEQRRRTRDQETLSNIARIIGSSLAIDEVYERFAREVSQLIPFDRIVINLVADRPGFMVDTYQSSMVEVPDRAPDQAYVVEGTLSDAVIKSKRCIVFQPGNEAEAAEGYVGLFGAYGMGLRSFLSAPLLYRGEPIGCLNLHSLTEFAYSDRHRLLAERMASISPAQSPTLSFMLRSLDRRKSCRARIESWSSSPTWPPMTCRSRSAWSRAMLRSWDAGTAENSTNAPTSTSTSRWTALIVCSG